MYVCICNGVTDKEIKKAVAAGAGSLAEVRERLGVASQCGSCADMAMAIIEENSNNALFDEALFYAPA